MKINKSVLPLQRLRVDTYNATCGGLWRSLEVSPYTFFDRVPLDLLLQRMCKFQQRKQCLSGECIPVVNLQLSVHNADGTKLDVIDSQTFIFAEPQMCGAFATNGLLGIITLRLTVTSESVIARKLRTPELPLGAAGLLGLLPHDIDQTPKPTTMKHHSSLERDRVQREIALFADCIERGSGLFVRDEVSGATPVVKAMLIDDLARRRQENRQIAAAAFAAKLERIEKAAEKNDKGKSRKTYRSGPRDHDVYAEEMLSMKMDELTVPSVVDARQSELEWLRIVVENGAYEITATEPELYPAALVLKCSRRHTADPFVDNLLYRILFTHSEQKCIFYALSLARLRREANRSTTLSVPAPAESIIDIRGRLTPSLENNNTNSSIAADIGMVDSIEAAAPPLLLLRSVPDSSFVTWLDIFDSLDHADLSLYELDTYARSRMSTLTILMRAHADDVRATESADLLNFWAFQQYPQRSGAVRSILDTMGLEARRREALHEAIGTGFLAIVARHDEKMRDSLLAAELFWLRYRYVDLIQMAVVGDGSIDGDVEEVEMTAAKNEAEEDRRLQAMCDSLETFWSRSCPDIKKSPDPVLAAAAIQLAENWHAEMERE